MIYFYCTSLQFFQMIVKWRISHTTEQIMFTFSILLFHFYLHIPCGMWRIPKLKHFVLLRFLLTHPMWDVTKTEFITCISLWFLLTHPVWDVTSSTIDAMPFPDISTHTSRVGCDLLCCHALQGSIISTHTSRVGCDQYEHSLPNISWHFYSHIPCGMWRCYTNRSRPNTSISTHTSRVGCDYIFYSYPDSKTYFYSHIPCGMWLILYFSYYIQSIISTHTSRVGCDVCIPCRYIYIM